MSQHAMTIADQPGASFRADLNNMASAIATLNSGATAPATTYAYMWWPDTANDILKQRNAANSGWINVLKLSTGAPFGVSPRATRIDVASAATLDLTTLVPDTDDLRLTGTGAITLVNLAVGRVVRIVASGASSFANNANIVTQTGATIQLAAGDTLMLRATAENVVEVLNPVCPRRFIGDIPSSIRLQVTNGYGSTNNKIRRFSNVIQNQGSDITYADSATLGATFTINASGVYSISYSDAFTGADYLGLSINSNQLTTSILSITAADVLGIIQTPGANTLTHCSFTGYFAAGDVIRAHTSGVSFGAVGFATFAIARCN